MSYSNDTKPSGSYTSDDKPAVASYLSDAKPSGSFSSDAKPTVSSYSNDAKPDISTSFLLKEDAFYLLLETGDKIVLRLAVNYSYDAKPS